MVKIEEIPVFIRRSQLLEWIKQQDKTFHDELIQADEKITFSFEDYYYAPGMNGYMVKIHFNYTPASDEFGKSISNDFYKLKAQYNESIKEVV